MPPAHRPRSLRPLVLLLALCLLSTCSGPQAPLEPVAVPGTTAAPPSAPAMDYPAAWKEVDTLIDEKKRDAALRRAQEILAVARQAGDEEQWARALICITQLNSARDRYETAVRSLI